VARVETEVPCHLRAAALRFMGTPESSRGVTTLKPAGAFYARTGEPAGADELGVLTPKFSALSRTDLLGKPGGSGARG
jgi:hypothetical protein